MTSPLAQIAIPLIVSGTVAACTAFGDVKVQEQKIHQINVTSEANRQDIKSLLSKTAELDAKLDMLLNNWQKANQEKE